MASNKTIILTGPTAAGKTEMARHLLANLTNLARVTPTTTRPMRSGEVEDVSYHFLSREQFEELIATEAMLEWTVYDGNYYGIQQADFDKILSANKTPVAVMDIPGAKRMRAGNQNAVTIFIAPDSLSVIEHRLSARGMSPDALASRLRISKEEMESQDSFDYKVLNLDGHFDEALAEVSRIVVQELGV